MHPELPGRSPLPVIWLIHSTLGNSAVVIFAVLLFFLGIWASRVYIDISGDEGSEARGCGRSGWPAIAISFLPESAVAYIAAFFLFRFLMSQRSGRRIGRNGAPTRPSR